MHPAKVGVQIGRELHDLGISPLRNPLSIKSRLFPCKTLVKHHNIITIKIQTSSNSSTFKQTPRSSSMRFCHFGILAALVVAAPVYGSPLAASEDSDTCKVGKHHPCHHDGISRCCPGEMGYAWCDGHIWTHVACGLEARCGPMMDKLGNDDKHHVECKMIDS